MQVLGVWPHTGVYGIVEVLLFQCMVVILVGTTCERTGITLGDTHMLLSEVLTNHRVVHFIIKVLQLVFSGAS
jgi:hypothetical protein